MNGGVYLLLGSNVGDSIKYLKDAIDGIGKFATVLRASAVYRSEPWGKTDQPPFLNQALEIACTVSAEQLLTLILQTEMDLGRERLEHWGPRTIDIDILLFGDEIFRSPRLTVPHAELVHRRFALLPLAEIAPKVIHPVLEVPIRQLLATCRDHSKVERL